MRSLSLPSSDRARCAPRRATQRRSRWAVALAGAAQRSNGEERHELARAAPVDEAAGSPVAKAPVATGRRGVLLAWTGAALYVGAAGRAEAALAGGVACPGLGGYKLQQCLREARKAREAAEAEAEAAGGEAAEAVRAERLRREKQFEQPGTLVTLPSGLQYREIVEGSGPAATRGSVCEVAYIVYRLASGGYYKYSGGGTPVFMFSLGYGQEGKDDVGVTYRFRLGDPDSLPAAVTPVLEGMRQGGKRRVLVPPRFGWVTDKTGPRPDTFGGQRRLAGHKDEPLLFEAELVRVRGTTGEAVRQAGAPAAAAAGTGGGAAEGVPYRLPAPPSYYGQGQAGQ